MTGNSHLFSRPLSPAPFPSVTLADGSTSSVLGSGTIHLTPSFSLSSVLHLPNLSFNLISTSQLTHDLNCVVMFFSGYCLFQDRVTKKIIGRGYESGGLYLFDHQVSQAVACPIVPSPFEVHCRLGHPSLFVLKKLYPKFRSLSSLNCDSCQFAKFHCLSSSPRVDKRAIASFELVHSDIWGPCPVVSQTGFRYFVTFVDDHSRLTWLYLMKNRSELLSHFCAFHTEIKNHFNVSIKLSVLIMRVNTFLILLALTCVNMALFINLPVLTLHLKMVLQNEKIGIYLKLPVLNRFKCMFQKPFGRMLSLQLVF